MTEAAVEAAPRRRRPRWVPGILALAALLGIGFVVGAGGDLSHPPPKSLSGSDLAAQLAIGIQAARSLSSPPAVSCPAHEPLKAGFAFMCRYGDGKPIEVVETDGRGHLRWSLPAG